MDEMIMIKEETSDDSLTESMVPCGSDYNFFKDAMTLDAVLRLERLLNQGQFKE